MTITRKILMFEIETNLPERAFKHATIRISQAGGKWNGAVIRYLEQPVVDTVRKSVKARKRGA